MKMNVKAFSLTCALLWGFGLLFLTWWIILFDGSTGAVTFLGRIYRGYNISLAGSFIGFIWAFFDGLLGGFFFSLVYNFLAGKFLKRKMQE